MASSGAPSALLGAANIEKYKGLAHSVGPFGLRVGFAYQQERALNIVASLKLEGHLKDNPKIAIVGGGLAGMTAYIALHGLGLAATQLFEMSDGVVRVQHAASHRPIHPCYNNWPIAEFFNPTTSLPFFNWSTGSAQYVADSLQYRWKKHYCDSFREINHLHRVTKINLVEGSNGLPSGLMLSSEKQDPSTRLWASIEDQKFDRVIFASGFGEESHLNISRCESYWTPDSIDALREDGGAENIFISGTGDGGLMDCVRFCFREANDRNLFIEFISYLRHPKYGSALEDLNDTKFEQSKYEQAIKKIEDRALELLPDNPDPTMDPFGSSWENKISDYLQTEYLKIIDDLPKGPLKFLEELLFPGWKKIRLIGRTTTPFSCATAPINKLVVAYLIRNNPDLYIQGYMDIDASPLLLLRPDYSKQNLDDEILVIRHGANPPVYEFSDEFKKRNRSLHKALANFTTFDRTDVKFCEYIRGTAECDPLDKAYIETRLELAQEFGLNYLGVKVNRSAEDIEPGVAPYFEFNHKQDEYLLKGDRVFRQPGGHPHDLFGIRLLGVKPLVPRTATGFRS